MESVARVYHKGVSGYDFGPGHPLGGDRFPRFMDLIEDRGLLSAFYPVYAVVGREMPYLLVLRDKIYGIRVFEVDRNILTRILAG